MMIENKTPKDDLMKCRDCGELFDPADLGAVFEHMHEMELDPESVRGIRGVMVTDVEQEARLDGMMEGDNGNL